MFSHSKSLKPIDPQGVAKFDPRGMVGTFYTDRQKKPDTFSCCIKSLSLVRGELFFVCKHLLLFSNDFEIVLATTI